ncbi:MAG: glycosyltransferase family 2 protein [Nanoarchaeota archaeon]|nr:glycosyltransferase family 2 protein [Nanoarchaeota archaeon]MBU4352529.1 glycosyltransferase family 2 protein [Nanoarchaeota archaeon]MBU4456882.1 glycosyltransferase family 2 protein [Nanoarchaeota archaeon]MCG2719847.1 glycosyltransferase family 2 protein [Nanoarchaeota archaeon]
MNLSIIIPAYNEEKYIQKTLESINVDNVEVIVVCNGCTDKTFKVASNYAKKSNKKIKVFNLKKKGVSIARNYGAKKASKKRLIFLDADIRVWHDVLEKINKTKKTVGTCYVRPDIERFVPKALMKLKNLTHKMGTCTGLIFCDKNLFFTIGGFDETMQIGEDGRFLRHARKAGKYGVVKAFAYNNMRRFEKKGYCKTCCFWIKHFFNPKQKEYEAIR